MAAEAIMIARGGGTLRKRIAQDIKMIDTVPVTVATKSNKRGMTPIVPIPSGRSANSGIVSHTNPERPKAPNVTMVLSIQATVIASVRRSSAGS